jgi:hypothetical protein
MARAVRANNEDEYTFRNAAIDDGEAPLWVNRAVSRTS